MLVVEVASESTKGNDQGDKRAAYAAMGVPEYIVFDPDGRLLATPLVAWRLDEGTYVPWRPDADGWWHSTTLDLSFQPGRPYMSVRDRDGAIVAPSGSVRRHACALEQERVRLEQQLAEAARTRAELEEMVRRLHEQRGEPETP